MDKTLVKYLGAYLGVGDLSHLNFEKPLHLVQQKIQAWSSRSLTLKARVIVAKTFIFSLFTHILNTVYITNNQLEIIQKILNEFLWRGWNKIKPSVIMSPETHGGLNMIHVKNAVHCLWVKWINHMCHDVSSSWS